ncbi:MAG: 16S rRNA (adenine(1518)-N(6)/adenine(1519)-N(6))-dimethyltransferase RsmA, partial [Acidimicrobiia bacterium]
DERHQEVPMRATRSTTLNSDINVTPLVDVCLVLLIIFMVVLPALVNGVPVALPESSTSSSGGSGLTSRPLITATEARQLARKFGIKPSKTLGQNFVVDPNTVRRVVRLAQVRAEDRVVEVGAGLGSLTVALANVASHVYAVEFDRALLPALEEIVGELPNVTVVSHDAMTLDFSALLKGETHRFISNLPYNIATPLLARLVEEAPEIEDFVAMIQKEVGGRFVAVPGSKTYGSVSVLMDYYCTRKTLGKVPRTVFWPQPDVESVIVQLRRREPVVAVDPQRLMKVVRAAFSQRRKTLRNALSAYGPERVVEVLKTLSLPAKARAEELSLEQFAALTEALD